MTKRIILALLTLLMSGQAVAWIPVDDVVDRGPEAGEFRYNQTMLAETGDLNLISATRRFLETPEGRRLQKQLGTEGAFAKAMATNLSLTMRHQKLGHFPNVIWDGDVPSWTLADVTVQSGGRYLIVVGKNGLHQPAQTSARPTQRTGSIKPQPLRKVQASPRKRTAPTIRSSDRIGSIIH